MGQRDILIVVKTYPEISSKYTETVCTAGILADFKTLVRPIRFVFDILRENSDLENTSGLELISTKHPQTFCVLGFFWPPKRRGRQMPLFN